VAADHTFGPPLAGYARGVFIHALEMKRVRAALVAGSVAVLPLLAVAAAAELVPCRRPADSVRIAQALRSIQESVDPCGQSPQVLRVMETLERCATARYEVCTSGESSRNLFDRPHDRHEPRTIIWNPELRTELEPTCDLDPTRPVLRDPTASLLHELVHAAHDCAGLDPGAQELEAVRIENIYRRAAGLCQRGGYGDRPLADPCVGGRCACPGESLLRSPISERRRRPSENSSGAAG
jgi:hypothetical protein